MVATDSIKLLMNVWYNIADFWIFDWWVIINLQWNFSEKNNLMGYWMTGYWTLFLLMREVHIVQKSFFPSYFSTSAKNSCKKDSLIIKFQDFYWILVLAAFANNYQIFESGDNSLETTLGLREASRKRKLILNAYSNLITQFYRFFLVSYADFSFNFSPENDPPPKPT